MTLDAPECAVPVAGGGHGGTLGQRISDRVISRSFEHDSRDNCCSVAGKLSYDLTGGREVE